MKKTLSSGIALVLCIMLSSCVKEFSFSPQTVISVEDPQQRAVAEWFAWHFACPGGFVPIVQVGASDADVLLRTDASIPGNSYRIRVTGKKTLVEASSSAGFLYAMMHIRRSLPEDINSLKHADSVRWVVPEMSLYGSPETQCSGLLIDVAQSHICMDCMLHLLELMPDMDIYDLTLTDDGGLSEDDVREIRSSARRYGISLIFEEQVADQFSDDCKYNKKVNR
jgi:hypothetical protein